MPFEIVTTECEKGILKGTKGFCPVAVTEGTPKPAIAKLFKLAKKQAEKLDDHRQNTRHFFAHFPLKLDDQKFHLLTRGTRPKKENGAVGDLVVHQLLLSSNELANEGPAAMLANEKHWFTTWSAQPQMLKPRAFETTPLSPRICKLWKETTGDPGWAGTPVEAWLNEESFALIATPNVKSRTLIQMLTESQSLMPVESRWKVPISIAAWHPFGMDAKFWSAFDKGTQAEIDAMQHASTARIDLSGDLAKASGKFSNAARLGAWVQLDSVNGKVAPGTNEDEPQDELLLKSPETPVDVPKVAPAKTPPLSIARPQSQAGISSKQMASSISAFAKLWLPSSVFGWVKTIAIALFAVTIPVLLWFGYKLSQDIISAAGSVESPAIMVNGSSPESETESNAESSEVESTNVPEPAVPEVAKSPLKLVSVGALKSSLKTIKSGLIVDLPESKKEKTYLFSIDQTNADFDGQLFLSADLLDERVSFVGIDNEDSEPDQRWNFPLKIGGKETIVASVLYERDSGKFFWQWADDELSPNTMQNILSGRILFAVDEPSSVAAEIRLARPAFSKPISLFDMAKSPVVVQPHVSDWLTAQQNFRKHAWSISDARVLPDGADNSLLDENKEFDVEIQASRVILRYDQQLIRKELNEWLGSKFSDSIKNQTELDKLLEYHGPFGYSMLLDYKASTGEQSGIAVTSSTNVLIKGIDSDNSAIYLPRMKDEPNPKSIKKFEDDIKRKIAIDVCEYLGITDSKIVEAIYRGRKKSSRDITERIRLAIAGVVYKKVCVGLHLPIQLEVTRKFRGFNREFTAVAMTWKPELLGGETELSETAPKEQKAD